MDSDDTQKNKIALIILAVVAVGVFVWFLSRGTVEAPVGTATGTTPDVPTADTGVFGTVSNPAVEVGENVPETNPFTETKTNPFTGYKNPFSR
ncbi:MAG: hypothetical protein COW88_00625 [Candidatus Lloydbacteria bacterium CG22_combo_CG10-13_8_21_14_all_47_15]|uniref:Uncharacterized protein n=1 Tax=Candidatus Lloydbacteria bacterium CG22_combo_CG10-13_8_21_14_all_47_15 TaxID=1974635 RepID=A0A2H0CV84_9BACT|nr:MAG: hypothetical protein COW88_00625 [Candidatus Lloydbacteria bacterium CG22_combo_CG10-13_8_21_14_all_47_15]